MAKKKPMTILLQVPEDVIRYFKGEIPDWEQFRSSPPIDDIRVSKEIYLRAIELVENSKHIH